MKKRIFIMLLTCLIISSCSGYVIGGGNTSPVEETEVIQEDLFKSEDGSSFIFKTNNKKYLKNRGYTIWSLPKTNNTDSFGMDVDILKQSGKDNMGYGIVFSAYETQEGISKMQAILIDVNQNYIIGNISDGKFEASKSWTYTKNLNGGYNTNNIKINFDENEKKFKLFFNGLEEPTFSSITDNFQNTSYGFVATISPYEDFDSSFVWIEYKLK